jgi:hypothetical protein
VRIRIENLGAQAVAYGYPYRLARLVKGVWVNLPTGPFLMPRLYAQPGKASECQTIQMSEDAVDGIYRISKEVSPTDPGMEEKGLVTIRTTFRVR